MNALQKVLSENTDKRIVVVGTTCIGKSTLVHTIPNAIDLDEVLFPQLSQEEKDMVCQEPWTPTIGEYMGKLIREKIKVTPGYPLFSTEIIDCDLVVYLRALYKCTLEERCKSRGASLANAMKMDERIFTQLGELNLPTVTIFVDA